MDIKNKNRRRVIKKRSDYSVQAVSNAIRILETLGNANHEQSLPEISRQLSLTKSNTANLLATLENFGYVDLNHYTKNFSLGVKTFQISQSYINKLNLLDVALPVQKELVTECGETVYVSVLRKSNVVYLGVVETEQSVRVVPRIGNVGPAYAMATGKVQLAYIDEQELKNMYPGPFVKYTPNTIPCYEDLLPQLLEIRKKGYAVDNEEYDIGVRCIAAPLRNFMANVIGALSITAPVERLSKEKVLKFAPKLLKAAKVLSEKFGYVNRQKT